MRDGVKITLYVRIDKVMVVYVLRDTFRRVGCAHRLRVYAVCQQRGLERDGIAYEAAVCRIEQTILGYPNACVGINKRKSFEIELFFEEFAPYIPIYPRFFEAKEIKILPTRVNSVAIIQYRVRV